MGHYNIDTHANNVEPPSPPKIAYLDNHFSMIIYSFNPFRFGLALLALAGLISGCDSKPANTDAVPLPEYQAPPITEDGIRLQALAYLERQQSEASFGFDIRSAGLLPVQVSIDNRSGAEVKIIPRQTFLIDQDDQAWPLLTTYQAFKRLDGQVSFIAAPATPDLKDMESLTGFALDLGIGTRFAPNAHYRPGTRVDANLTHKNLRNPKIPAGKVASGILFFPSREEANGVRSLRLCYTLDGQFKFLNLPLANPLPNKPMAQ